MRILVVEDDPTIARLLRFALEREGHDITHVKTGAEGIALVGEWGPDVILLDVMLPDMNGYEIAREIRTASDVPLVMLTALGQESERIRGLDVGADDYIVKPFSVGELEARLRAIFRRVKGETRTPNGQLRYGDLHVNTNERRVFRGPNEVSLTKREFEILRMLMQYPGKLVSRSAIAHALWGRSAASATNLLDVHMSALRRKLDDPSRPSQIETVRGEGFRLRDEAGTLPSERVSA